VPDLPEGESQPPGPPDESQPPPVRLGVLAVSGTLALRQRQQPTAVVEPHRLDADPSPAAKLPTVRPGMPPSQRPYQGPEPKPAHGTGSRRGVHGRRPVLAHRWKTSIFAFGQAPSQGIEPSRRRARISAARELTSSNDHRSNAKLMDCLSLCRNSGLMCAAKL